MKLQTNKRERGVAILFSLGILGMMTVLALTFASVSMTNQTIAKNSTRQVEAKEMARGVVERIQSALSHSGYTGGVITTPAQLRNLYSKASGSSDFDWIWKLGMTGTDIESALYRTDEICDYSNTGGRPTSNPAFLPTWQYVKSGPNSTDPIIGRFAYVVRAADLPVLDFNTAFLQENGSESTCATSSPTPYTRLGMSLNEINPNHVYEATLARLSIISSAYYKFSDIDSNLLASVRTGLASSGRLGSYADFETYLPSTLTETNKKQISKVIANAYYPRSVRYPELFLNSSGVAVYRFDLSQIPRNATVDQRRQWVNDIVSSDDTKLAQWGSNGITTKIPWLAASTDSAGGYSSPIHKSKQIAANLVDFVTGGNAPTWGFINDDLSNENKYTKSWFTATPDYIGLKKTPYLLGFGGVLEFVVTQTYTEETAATAVAPATYTHNLNLTVKFTPYAELCNLYKLDVTPGKNLKLACKGDITIRYSVNNEGEDAWRNASISIDTTSENDNTGESTSSSVDLTDPFVVESHYKERTQNNEVNFPTPTTNKYETYTVEIKKVEFSNFRIGLHYNGHWVDFSVINHTAADKNPSSSFSWDDSFDDPSLPGGDPKGNTKLIINDKHTSGSKTMGVAFRVSDPRHNLFSSCWKGKISLDRQTYVSIIGPLDDHPALLPMEAPPTGTDLSSNPLTTHPGNTNAHIPQNTITTPWEIGQIHRGNTWETINLKTFKETNPTQGGSYSDGDANLLDQLRLSSDTAPYGKIPLNEIWGQDQSNIIFEVLQRNACHTTPEKSDVDDSAGDSGFRNTNFGLVHFFDTKKGHPNRPYFEYRSELAKILTYSSDYKILASDPNSDAGKEELFAKCVMLFDTEQTFLPRRVYVFGIAQTIKDIGGSGSNITVYKVWNNDGDYSHDSEYYVSKNKNKSDDKKDISEFIGRYNAGYRTDVISGIDVVGRPTLSGTINAQIGQYDNGADKILSEQKFFAILEREYTPIPYSSSNRPQWKIVRFEYVQ